MSFAYTDAMMLATRCCSKCGQDKPETTEFFVSRAALASGLTSHCRDCHRDMARGWYARNSKRSSEIAASRRQSDPEAVAQVKRRFWEKNRDRLLKYHADWQRNRRSTPKGKIDDRMGARLRRALGTKKSSRSWPSLVGYSLEVLADHLERQFLPGMTWDNIGEWHVDHILPLASFHYETTADPEFKAAWSLANLRPLWGRENYAKGARRHLLL
jgi:hypothetical protein